MPVLTLSVGRIVRFVCQDGSTRPAIVVGHRMGWAYVRVLLGKHNAELPEFTELERTTGTAYRECPGGPRPGCWRWPPEWTTPPKEPRLLVKDPPPCPPPS